MGWLFSKHEPTPAPEDDQYWEQFTPLQDFGRH